MPFDLQWSFRIVDVLIADIFAGTPDLANTIFDKISESTVLSSMYLSLPNAQRIIKSSATPMFL